MTSTEKYWNKTGTISCICCFLSRCRSEIRKPANTDASWAFSRFTNDQNSKEDGCLQPHLCFQDVAQALYLVSQRYGQIWYEPVFYPPLPLLRLGLETKSIWKAYLSLTLSQRSWWIRDAAANLQQWNTWAKVLHGIETPLCNRTLNASPPETFPFHPNHLQMSDNPLNVTLKTSVGVTL